MTQRELSKATHSYRSSRLKRFIPNLLSLFRLFSSPIIGWMILNLHPFVLPAFIFSGVTDWLDGFAARKLNIETLFGRLLDPIADKVLISTVFICFWKTGMLPGWFIGTILLRDIMIIIGASFIIMKKAPFDLKPSGISKINTFFQLLLALLLILSITLRQPFYFPVDSFTSFTQASPLFICILICGIIVFITTILSGLYYFWSVQKRVVEHYVERAIKSNGDN